MKVCKVCQRIFANVDDFLHDTQRWRIGPNDALFFECSCQTTLVIPKGFYDWYSPARFLRQEARQIFEKLGLADFMPTLPGRIASILSACNDMNVSTAELSNLVKAEPIVCSELLNIANDITSRRGNKVRTVEHAILYLGRRSLANLLQVAALRLHKFRTSSYTSDIFWREALTCGSIAEAMSRVLPSHLSPDEAYVAGCLCNVGKIVASIYFPDDTDRVWRLIRQDMVSWTIGESSEQATDHAILGEIAAMLWVLPRFVMEAAANHHGVSKEIPSRRQQGNMMIALANQVTHLVLEQESRLEHETCDRLFKALNKDGVLAPDFRSFARSFLSLADFHTA